MDIPVSAQHTPQEIFHHFEQAQIGRSLGLFGRRVTDYCLHVEPNETSATESALQDARKLAQQVRAVLEKNPDADPENVRHTLLLLKLPPEERLRRALTRGKLYKFTAK